MSLHVLNEFSHLCDQLRKASGHKDRSELIASVLREYKSDTPQDDIYRLLRFLLPKELKFIFNIKDKQLIHLFSQLFTIDKDLMLEDLEHAEDVATTIGRFFTRKDSAIHPNQNSSLHLKEVEDTLRKLSNASKETERMHILKSITRKSTVSDLITVVRLIRQDLRINAGYKQILDGLHPQAYAAFHASHDLGSVINKVFKPTNTASTNSGTIAHQCTSGSKKPIMSRTLSTGICLMTPVKPMLAEACRSANQALAKADPDGQLLAEIKYDGERVQIHKNGNKFAFYSRSLKPVPSNKVSYVEPHIPKAFTAAEQLVIDCEILLLDTKTNKPLPFGSLGTHKRTAFDSASVCVFVFDCLFVNGESLIHKPISYRRSLLEKYFCEVPNHVLLSEKHIITDVSSLNNLMARVFSEKLEGLVLKPFQSMYEPGKRHWLKIKRDYLAEGSMADSVDLIVLGAYCGTGSKAGLMSVFLMGAYDPQTRKFTTVTKCGNGFTDEQLQILQKTLRVQKVIKKSVPSWLNVSKSLIPDFVVSDPKSAPVWEITGAEFSRANTHTAGTSISQSQGISLRFPRYTKSRPDKTWEQATNVMDLEKLVAESGQRSDWLEILSNVSSGKPSNIAGMTRKISSDSSAQFSTSTKVSRTEHDNNQLKSSSRHLSTSLSGMFIAFAEDLKLDGSELRKLLRLLVAHGAQFTGSVDPNFCAFTTQDTPTHLIVPSGYNKPSHLIQISIDQVGELIHTMVSI